MKENFLNLTRGMYEKLKANIILNGETWNTFSLRLENKAKVSALMTSVKC